MCLRACRSRIPSRAHASYASRSRATVGGITEPEDRARPARLGEGEHETRALLDSLLAIAPVGIAFLDTELRFVRINAELATIHGRSPEDHVGRTLAEMLPAPAPILVPVLQRVLETGEPVRDFDVIGETPAAPGEERIWKSSYYPIPGADGRPIGVSVVVQDVTRRSEQALEDASKAHLLDSISDAVLETSHPDFRITAWNRAAEEIYGWKAEEALGRPVEEVIPWLEPSPQYRARTLRGLAGTGRLLFEAVQKRRDGQPIRVEGHAIALRDAAGRTTGYVSVNRDITERRRLEENLRQAQKMEAVGLLAGGVAHDFNNMLTAIRGYAYLALAAAGHDATLRSHLQEIGRAAESAGSLTRQLLAFSRRQMLAPKVLDLNDVVASTETMRRRLVPENIELAVDLDPELGRVEVDPTQIEQVILNLAINAREAMPEGGRLTIGTANVELDESYARVHPELEPGSYVMLAVSDTGHGMDEETRLRLFEPFFTTRDEGTGLGLATVYGIVRQSGGYIEVSSEPELGTSFKVYFPRVEASAETSRTAAQSPPQTLAGSETILLVEDEDAVRRLVQVALENRGYTVLAAGTPDEALGVADEREAPIELILTDVVLPGIDGRALLERLSALHPEARALYMSGYAEDAIVHHGVLDPGIAFLPKPFTPDALALKVREVLDAP